jgi:hypothetical protein
LTGVTEIGALKRKAKKKKGLQENLQALSDLAEWTTGREKFAFDRVRASLRNAQKRGFGSVRGGPIPAGSWCESQLECTLPPWQENTQL